MRISSWSCSTPQTWHRVKIFGPKKQDVSFSVFVCFLCFCLRFQCFFLCFFLFLRSSDFFSFYCFYVCLNYQFYVTVFACILWTCLCLYSSFCFCVCLTSLFLHFYVLCVCKFSVFVCIIFCVFLTSLLLFIFLSLSVCCVFVGILGFCLFVFLYFCWDSLFYIYMFVCILCSFFCFGLCASFFVSSITY